MTVAEKFEQLGDNVVKEYLNCSLKDIYSQILTNIFQTMGQKAKVVKRCLRSHIKTRCILKCLSQLRRSCFKSKVVVIKTIRYSMSKALTLMERDPKVKVIHLIRDPRGTIYSLKKRAESKVITQKTVRANIPRLLSAYPE